MTRLKLFDMTSMSPCFARTSASGFGRRARGAERERSWRLNNQHVELGRDEHELDGPHPDSLSGIWIVQCGPGIGKQFSEQCPFPILAPNLVDALRLVVQNRPRVP